MENRKQHFLPVAYLQFFSTDQASISRDSFVWRFDGKRLHEVPVESQCRGDYFYTATQLELERLTFNAAEGDWPSLVRRLQSGVSGLAGRDYKLAMIQLVVLYLRNEAIANETSISRLDAFERDLPPLLLHIFGPSNSPIRSRQELTAQLWASLDSWSLQPILAATGSFVSSDNPTLVFSDDEAINLIAAPICPSIYLVAYRASLLSVKSPHASADDVEVLNIFQARNSIAQVYSSTPISSDQKSAFREAFRGHEHLGAHTRDGLRGSAFDYDRSTRKVKFSFLTDKDERS